MVAIYAWKVRRNFNESVSLSRLDARRSLRGYTLLCCNLMPWIASPSSPGPDFAHETCHTDPSKGSRRRPLVREALETTVGAMDALHDMPSDSERGLGQRGDPHRRRFTWHPSPMVPTRCWWRLWPCAPHYASTDEKSRNPCRLRNWTCRFIRRRMRKHQGPGFATHVCRSFISMSAAEP